MSDTLETALRRFDRPQHVEALGRQTFSLMEAADALEGPPSRIRDFHKMRVQLVSDPVVGHMGRRYCALDIYGLALFDAFDQVFKSEGRHALIIEFAQLLLGDAVSLQEGRDRRTDFAAEREKALKGNARTKEKSDKLLFAMHQARRLELQRDIFQAMPLWWARDPDRHFIILVAKNRQLFQFVADRTVNNGKIDATPFIEAGMVSSLDATKALMAVDERLQKIIAERDEEPEA